MNNKEIYLTYEGLKNLEEELEFLKGNKRTEIAERIKQALSFGDISENSEYDEAKNEQAQIETRIVQLENTLKNAKVIEEDDIKTDVVSLGAKVKLFDFEFEEEIVYWIVGSTEADPRNSKISNESPVGIALMGSKVGDEVSVNVPEGIIKFKVLAISK
jgi:transcription elongation factor GreA